jgi:PAS domain S-box-containing protein
MDIHLKLTEAIQSPELADLCLSYEDGKWYFFNTKEEVELLEDESLARRLKHYHNWCLENECTFSFEQIAFIDEKKDLVYSRTFSLKGVQETSYLLDISSTHIHDHTNFRHLFNESLLNSISDAVIVAEADPIGSDAPIIIFANKAFEQMTGYTSCEVLGKNPNMLQRDDASSMAKDNIKKALENWQSIQQEILNYKKCGEPFLVELNISPVRDDTGWWTHWISIQRNMTEREKERERFEIEKKRFERMEETGRIGFWELEVATGKSHWSKEVYRIHALPVGTPTNKVKGISFYAPHDQPRISQYVTDCITKKEIYDDEFEFYDANNNKKWVRAYGEPIEDKHGNVHKLFGTFQEITEFKEKEMELKLVLESSRTGIWKLDLLKDELHWDDSMYQLYQIEKSDFTGDYDAWEKTLHPDSLETASQEIASAIRGETKFDTEFKIIVPSGEVREIKARAEVLRNSEGDAIALMGVNWDITEEKEKERQRLDQEEYNIHQSKLASIGELSAGVGHEINNPLTIAQAYLGKIAANSKCEDSLSDIKKTQNALDRIKNIVTGLRSFARNDKEQTCFDFIAAIKESMLLLNEIYTNEGIEIVFTNTAKQDVFITGMRGRIQQVFVNLLTNAKDAIANQKDKKIDIHLSTTNGKVQLKVQDNGTGISAKNLDKIFNNFFTTKDIGQGTGIGLSLCQKVIQEHSGRIHVESELGKGTQFTVELPTSDDKKCTSIDIDCAQSDQELTLSNLNILVVDDEQDLRELITDMLTAYEIEVTQAGNGQEALEIYSKDPTRFDLVITDIRMPVLSGPDFVKEAKQFSGEHSSKFIFITGGVNTNLDDPDGEYAQLMDGHIYKPFTDQELVTVINKVLSK